MFTILEFDSKTYNKVLKCLDKNKVKSFDYRCMNGVVKVRNTLLPLLKENGFI